MAVGYGTISWTETPAVDATISFYVRAGNVSVPDTSWTGWTLVANGGSLSSLNGNKYVQQKINFQGNGLAVPVVSDITVSTYTGTLLSSAYDTKASRNQLLSFHWNTVQSGWGNVSFQIQTSRDALTWNPWCDGMENPSGNCNTSVWFENDSGTNESTVVLDNGQYRYVRYQLFFSGNAQNQAIVQEVNIAYDKKVYQTYFTSTVKDFLSPSLFQTLSWTETPGLESTLAMEVRSGNTPTPDGTWSSWIPISNGGDISQFAGNRYLQYKATFSSYNVDESVILSDVNVAYTQYPVGAFSLLSSPYNASSSANLLSRISWNETLQTDTAIKFQLRTAPDGAGSPNWASGSKWCGPTTCAATSDDTDFASDYYTTASGQTTNSIHYDGANDQWMQYATFLENQNSGVTPTLSEVMLTYVVNAPPLLENVIATPTENKTVLLSYDTKDPDTTTGNIPNLITPSFEYWNGSTWIPILSQALESSDLQNKSVNESTYTTHTATWTPSVSDATLYLSGTAKVRVSVTDNEGANNIARAESNTFTLDTKTPTNPSLLVDASTQDLTLSSTSSTLTIGASDDSTVSMKLSLLEDLSDASWEPFNANKTIKLETDPDRVYVRFKDQYGNETQTISTDTIETPTRIMTQDTSNMLMTPPEYRVFVGFKTVAEPTGGFANYKLYRSEDEGSFTLLNSVTSRTSNFLTDSSTEEDKLYAYKVKSTDQQGNVSFFSQTVTAKANGVQDFGEGGGGSDGDPPTIANVTTTQKDTTTFTVTWETDELSNSTVEYGTSQGIYTKQVGVPTFSDGGGGSGLHSVTVTNLTPNTTYYFKVTSTDPQGNTGVDDNTGNSYEVTTNPGPSISNVSVASSYNNQATIVWDTNVPANTVIHYSEQKNNGQLQDPITISGSSVLTKNHSITLSGLSQGTDHYFRVTSTDSQGNIANDNNGGNYFQFRTTVDTNPPVFSNIETPVVSNRDAVITFTTDEPANNKLSFRKQGDSTWKETTTTPTYDRSHYIIVKNLFPETVYEYRFTVKDINQNETQSEEKTFKTLVDPEYDHPPIQTISDISDPPHILTDTKAVITFETDQIANCMIDYGTTSGSYNEIPTEEEVDSFNLKHSIHLSGLIFNTKYFYTILCEDNLQNVVESEEKSFTTKLKQVDSGSETAESTPPTISRRPYNKVCLV